MTAVYYSDEKIEVADTVRCIFAPFLSTMPSSITVAESENRLNEDIPNIFTGRVYRTAYARPKDLWGALGERVSDLPSDTRRIGLGKVVVASGRAGTEEAWFARALNLDARGQSDKALDLVYDQIDAWLRSSRFAECDAFLDYLDVESLSVRILLAVAVLTRPASYALVKREEFFGRAWKTLVSRGKNAERLLGGLRSTVHRIPEMRPSANRTVY